MAFGCFGLATVLAWREPMIDITLYLSFGIYIVGGVFIALFIWTLPSPWHQIVFTLMLLIGAALACVMLPAIRY